MENCRAYTLSQRQYQENFCLKECHIRYPPWQSPWFISKPWRRCLSWAEHTRHSCCPRRMTTCCCQSPQANMKPGLCPAGGSWKGTDTPKSFHYFLNSFSCNTKIPPVFTAGDIYYCAPTWRYMGKSYYPSANLMSQVLMCHLSTYSCHIYMKMCNYLFVCCCFIFSTFSFEIFIYNV